MVPLFSAKFAMSSSFVGVCAVRHADRLWSALGSVPVQAADTQLMHACRHCCDTLVAALLSAGADANEVRRAGAAKIINR